MQSDLCFKQTIGQLEGESCSESRDGCGHLGKEVLQRSGWRTEGVEPRRDSSDLAGEHKMESRALEGALRCADAGRDPAGTRMLANAKHCLRASSTPGVHPATGRGASQRWNTPRIAGGCRRVLWAPESLQQSKWKRNTKSSLIILANTNKQKKKRKIIFSAEEPGWNITAMPCWWEWKSVNSLEKTI